MSPGACAHAAPENVITACVSIVRSLALNTNLHPACKWLHRKTMVREADDCTALWQVYERLTFHSLLLQSLAMGIHSD